jgi:ornithine cyclodeaminase/alanine dehydrogenase
MALYVTEEEVGRLLTVEACIEALEAAFRQAAEGRAAFRPRSRAAVRGATLHVLPAASETLGRLAAKVYATTRAGARFVVLLFDAATSGLLAILEADRLGQLRTGAASGLATRLLSRPESRTLAILGTGWQARGQVRGIAAVRRLETVRAWGRDAGRLAAFCRDAEILAPGARVLPASTPDEAARGADIIVTATSAAEPVLAGGTVAPGAHLNAVGSNRAGRRELDEAVVLRADRIVVDSLEQARAEAGDLLGVPGALDRAVELAAVVAGRQEGRRGAGEVTLFKSLGIGLEDLAAASLVYDLARAAGAGRPVPGP